MVLVDEIDLDVAVLRLLPQVVLAHEPVEVDRARGAGVGLVVGHLGNGRDIRAHRAQHARPSARPACPAGMSTTTCSSDLLSKGSIFITTHWNAGSSADSTMASRIADPEPAPVAAPARASRNGASSAREPAREAAIEARGTVRGGCADVREPQREPRGERERDAERDQHPHAGVDRNRRHVRSHQSAHERHRQQRRDDRQRRQDCRSADFVHRRRNDLERAMRRARGRDDGGCSRPRRSHRRPGCRSRRSARTARRG